MGKGVETEALVGSRTVSTHAAQTWRKHSIRPSHEAGARGAFSPFQCRCKLLHWSFFFLVLSGSVSQQELKGSIRKDLQFPADAEPGGVPHSG